MERRVKQTENDRLAIHDLEGILDRRLDEGLKLVKRGLTLLVGVGHDHLAELGERGLAVLTLEHMLDTEESYTFCTE